MKSPDLNYFSFQESPKDHILNVLGLVVAVAGFTLLGLAGTEIIPLGRIGVKSGNFGRRDSWILHEPISDNFEEEPSSNKKGKCKTRDNNEFSHYFWNNPITQKNNRLCKDFWNELSGSLERTESFDRKMAVVGVCRSVIEFFTVGIKKRDLQDIEEALSIAAFYGGIDNENLSKIEDEDKVKVITANHVILMKMLEKRHTVFGRIFKHWVSEETKRELFNRRKALPHIDKEILQLSLEDPSCGLQLIRGPLNVICSLYRQLRESHSVREFFLPGSEMYYMKLLFNDTVRSFKEICPSEKMKTVLDTIKERSPQAEALYYSCLNFDNGTEFLELSKKGFPNTSKVYDRLFNYSFTD